MAETENTLKSPSGLGQAILPPLLKQRFRVDGPLTEEASDHEAYLGRDLVDGYKLVVIKTFPVGSVARATLIRLHHDMAILSELTTYQGGAPVLAYGEVAGCIYVVRPYLEASNLHTALLSAPPWDARAALDLARALTASLQLAHSRGILHRNIKPSNIFLPAKGKPEQAVLTDFGIVSSIQRHLHYLNDGGKDSSALYTVAARYGSPEQLGLIDQGIDERSDLYALGVVLFEALAGSSLFAATELNLVLLQQMSLPCPNLSALRPEIPLELADLVTRLLAKDPRDRYQSAASLAHDLDALKRLLEGSADEVASFALGQMDRRENLTEAAFVGRQGELAALEAFVANACLGRGGLLRLTGPSGVGKSRLLSEFERRCGGQGNLLVLRGQGLWQVARQPYDLLEGIHAGVLAEAGANKELSLHLKSKLYQYKSALCSLHPGYHQLFALDVNFKPSPQACTDMAMAAALGAFLSALGRQQVPAILIIDDGQWMDSLTGHAFQHWLEVWQDQPCFVAVILGSRCDASSADNPLAVHLKTTPQIPVPPLAEAELEALLTSMAGPLPAEVLTTVATLSGRNPFMATAILQGMVEKQAIVPLAGTWSIVPTAFAHLQSSRRAAALLINRLEALPKLALDFLSVGALLGRSFMMDFAIEVSGQTASAALAAVSVAKRRHILWEEASEGHYRFAHDKLRESFIKHLSLEQCQGVHMRAAACLQERLQERLQEGLPSEGERAIAYHYDAAGHSDLAYPFAMKAAAWALDQGALAEAEQQYRIAARGLSSEQLDQQIDVAKKLGDLLLLQGRYEEARPRLLQAKELNAGQGGGDALRAAAIEASLGELAFKCGEMISARDAIMQGLRSLGRMVPEHSWLFLLSLFWELLVLTLRNMVPAFLLCRRPAMDAQAELSAHLYSRLGYAYWGLQGKIPSMWTHLRVLNLSERYAESPQLARAYSEHACAMMAIPWHRRGLTYGDRSLAMRQRLGDVLGQSQTLNFRAYVFYVASRFEEAIADGVEALNLLRDSGDRWELNFAASNRAYSYYRLGELNKAVNEARHIYQEALHQGDFATAGGITCLWSMASLGAIPDEILERESTRDNDSAMTIAGVLLAKAIKLLLQERQPQAAVKALRRAQQIVQQADLRQDFLVPILPWLATALRLEAESYDPRDPRHKTTLAAAATTIRAARKLACHFRNSLPHTLREAAYIAAWQKRPYRAKRFIAKSLSLAQAQKASFEYAQSLEAQGTLGALFDWPEVRSACQLTAHKLQASKASLVFSGQQNMENNGHLALIGRFDAVLDEGRKLVKALDADTIFQVLLEASRKLFFSTHCYVVAPGAPCSCIVAGDSRGTFSQALVEEAVASQNTQTFDSISPGILGESLLLTDTRSALCVPIINAGKAVACLYVSHTLVGRPFHKDDIKLGQYLATLAGTALENADAYRRLQDLNKTLLNEARERVKAAEDLQRAKDAAEKATRVKSQFLANMSHEMRTPVTAILNYTDFLKDATVSTAEASRFLTTIERNGQQLTQLIDSLLDLTKVESGYLDIVTESFDVGALLKDVVFGFTSHASKGGPTLKVPQEAVSSRTIVSDPLRLRQILNNVIGNALKFTSAGEVEVSWKMQQNSSNDRQQIAFIVKDTGCGMPLALQQQIFAPFVQGDSSPTRLFGGTGLGLALARRLAQALGGDVELSSSIPEKGSVFTITILLGSASRPTLVRELCQSLP